MMPIQYTQKALEQLKKLREELEIVRKNNYMSQAVVTFKTTVNYALQDIFQNGCENSVWQEFDRQSKLANLEATCGRLTEEKRQWPFNFLAGKLDGYIKTIEMGIERRSENTEHPMTNKIPKIFISHAHADEKAANLLVDLLHDMGIPPNDDTHEYIFCSSTPGYDIPLRKRIYEHLKNEFEHHNLYVIFLLSSNYYKRPACLNEMGATWITETNYCSVLLPGFTFSQIEGAADADAISIALADDNAWEGLNNLRTDLQKFMNFNLSHNNFWETHRTKFVNDINALPIADEVLEKDSDQIRILELEEEVRNLKSKQIACDVIADISDTKDEKEQFSVTAKQAISRFLARPIAWNGKSFIGTFFIGGGLKNSYAVPMSDWLCQELKLDPGYPVTAKCVECESNKKIEVFATEDNADILSVIDTLSVIELQLKTVYFTYEDYDNCSYGSPPVCPYFIFEVEKVLSVKAYEQPVPEPF